MIHTLKLYTDKYDIKDISNFEHQEIYSRKTGEILSEKEFINREDIHITKKWGKIWLEFTVPGIFKSKGFYDYPFELLKKIPEKLYNRVSDLGVELDPDDLRISRLDIYKNIEVEMDASYYIILSNDLFQSGRYEKSFYKYPSATLTLYNKSKEVCLYDKRSEILKKHGIDINKEIVRSEVRFKKAKVIMNYLGIKTLKDLINSDIKNLKISYNREIGNKIIKKKIPQNIPVEGKKLDFLLGFAVNALGFDFIKETLKNRFEKGKMCKSTYYNNLKKTREVLDFYKKNEEQVNVNLQNFIDSLFYK